MLTWWKKLIIGVISLSFFVLIFSWVTSNQDNNDLLEANKMAYLRLQRHAKPVSASRSNIVFIITPGRAGSSFLVHLLNKVDGSVVIGEMSAENLLIAGATLSDGFSYLSSYILNEYSRNLRKHAEHISRDTKSPFYAPPGHFTQDYFYRIDNMTERLKPPWYTSLASKMPLLFDTYLGRHKSLSGAKVLTRLHLWPELSRAIAVCAGADTRLRFVLLVRDIDSWTNSMARNGGSSSIAWCSNRQGESATTISECATNLRDLVGEFHALRNTLGPDVVKIFSYTDLDREKQTNQLVDLFRWIGLPMTRETLHAIITAELLNLR
jgi:hypothetical protein